MRTELNIPVSKLEKDEIRKAIGRLKHEKAAGIDSICAEFLKADIETTTSILYALFSRIWEEEVIPQDWEEGLIIKLAKRGDLKNCNNWRGTSLLSVPGKVFLRIIASRITTCIDELLRKEQAGFRAKKGCIDHIFSLRNIIEQCIEWQNKIIINFVDFEKAFDNLNRDNIWEIMKSYGIPDKIINIIKLFYNNYRCSVLHNGTQSSWFTVKSGVRQGCVISPLPILIVIDWCMRRTI